MRFVCSYHFHTQPFVNRQTNVQNKTTFFEEWIRMKSCFIISCIKWWPCAFVEPNSASSTSKVRKGWSKGSTSAWPGHKNILGIYQDMLSDWANVLKEHVCIKLLMIWMSQLHDHIIQRVRALRKQKICCCQWSKADPSVGNFGENPQKLKAFLFWKQSERWQGV